MRNVLKSALFVLLLASGNTYAEEWIYGEKVDEMRGVTNTWVSLPSENTVPLKFPYSPGSSLAIVVRNMPKKYGTDVYLLAEKGQLSCSLRDCHFFVKFDDGAVEKIPATRSTGGSRDTLFLTDKATPGFIKKLKTAKKIIVEVDFYKASSQQFRFEPAKPLVWK